MGCLVFKSTVYLAIEYSAESSKNTCSRLFYIQDIQIVVLANESSKPRAPAIYIFKLGVHLRSAR